MSAPCLPPLLTLSVDPRRGQRDRVTVSGNDVTNSCVERSSDRGRTALGRVAHNGSTTNGSASTASRGGPKPRAMPDVTRDEFS